MPTAEYSILGDNPVGAGDDRLDFGTFVEPFAKRLILSRKNTPFTVGVFADWGQGKTTVLQMLRASLERQGCPTVWFDPWKYDSRETVWKGLALTLISEVRRHDKLMQEIRRKQAPLKSLLAEFLTSRLVGSKWAEKIVKAVETEPWSPSLLQELEATLGTLFELIDPGSQSSRLDRPLVLFVDDLDRCLPEPALAVMEALKLVLAKPGLIVVMGIAENELSRAVSAGYSKALRDTGAALDPEWGRSYLRKIIQMPFPLPAVTESSLDAYVGACLERSGVATALRGDERWNAIVREACGGNLREVKRFVNHFIAESDKTEANLAALAIDGVLLDPPRVAFFLLLDRLGSNFLDHVRRRADDPELMLRFQLAFMSPDKAADAAPDERDKEFYGSGPLQGLFRRCMTATGDRPPLVAPFGRREDFEPYLQFGRRPAAATPVTASAPAPAPPGPFGIDGSVQAPTEEAGQVEAIVARARSLSAAGRLDAARLELSEALSLARFQGDRRAEAAVLLQTGELEMEIERFDEAKVALSSSLALARELGDRSGESIALRVLARNELLHGQPQLAIETMQQAITLARQTGDALGEAAVLTDRGAAYEKLKDFELARASYLEAYEEQKRLGNLAAQLPILLSLASLEPDYDQAMVRCEEARNLAESLGDRKALMQVYQTKGRVQARWGRLGLAEASYRQAAEIMDSIGSRRDVARIFADQAETFEHSGYAVEAVEPYTKAAQIYRDAGDEKEAKRLERAAERLEHQDQQSG